MLPARRRIPRKDFPYILKSGKRFNSSHFIMYLASLPQSDFPSRFSFSISKKIAPLAVERNMYRRRGYAAISTQLPKIQNGFYCFFSFKKGTYPFSYSLMHEEIAHLLKASGMLQ